MRRVELLGGPLGAFDSPTLRLLDVYLDLSHLLNAALAVWAVCHWQAVVAVYGLPLSLLCFHDATEIELDYVFEHGSFLGGFILLYHGAHRLVLKSITRHAVLFRLNYRGSYALFHAGRVLLLDGQKELD